MDPMMQVVMAKWLVTVVVLFAGLNIQDVIAERRSQRTGNPF